VRYPRLYHDLAHLWPVFDPPEEYAMEAGFWRQALKDRLGPGRHRVLELGVGGGHLLSHLTADFQATAVDISPAMLENSRRLNPSVEHLEGDMRTLSLGRKFKAVLIHDAIAYMETEEDLRKTFATARAHLDPGGIFITVPDWFRETFKGTSVSHRTSSEAGRELTFIQMVTDPDPCDDTIETLFFYMISEDGKVTVEQDRHVTGLFSLDQWLEWMSKEGFEVEALPYPVYDDDGEGYLLVGELKG
jgi:SAM-dependent methyltransferase